MSQFKIADNTKKSLSQAYGRLNKPLFPGIVGNKTLKIKFVSGGFQVIKNVIEYESGRILFFVAYSNDSLIHPLIFSRSQIEDVSIMGRDGNFKNVKLRKVDK